ncbi:hypothetical protein GCM10011374_35330 [Kocuria dechangensis]|uniref:Uncharacterized protein n=1 Tax=Kocuria dechangensis TaxID=1176249 RepID=A0A917H5I2_9MICC|nr:hypothetical protein [Kocuria dechangensis]GGG67957.1 hypothetical protein GCM10011374_35330 [Kocuria dechangensis]
MHERPDDHGHSAPSVGGAGTERTAPAPDAPQISTPQWLSAFTATHWAGAALAAVGAYASMLICAALMLVMAFAGAALSADGATPSEIIDDAASSSGIGEDGPSAAWTLFSLPIQVVSMAFFGRLTLLLKTPLGQGPNGVEAFSILFSPLLIVAVGALALYFLGRRLLRTATPVGAASTWILSLAGGLVLALLVVVLASIFAIRYSDDASSYPMSLSVEAASAPPFFLAWLTGTLALASALASKSRPRRAGTISTLREQFLPSSGRVLPVPLVHLAVFGLPMAVGLIIVAFVEGGFAGGLSTPFWVPAMVLWFFSWGHLSGMSANAGGGARELLAWADVPNGGTFYLWGTGLPGWVVAIVLVLAAVSMLAASAVWLLRRDVSPAALARPTSWITLPVVYFLFGLLVTAIGRTAVSANAGAIGLGGATAAGSVHPAGWTCIVLLAVGLVVEALSRYVAPALVSALPAGLISRLGAPARSAATPEGYTARTERTGATATTSSAPVQKYVAAEREPMSAATRKRIRAALIVGGSLVVLVVAAAVTYSILSRTAFSPSKQVESYLQSVVDGRSTDAVQSLDPNVPTDQRLLLNDAVYGAAVHPVTAYTIQDVTVDGSTASVSAEITQDAVSTPVHFTLVQDGRQAGVFKDWRLENGGSALYQSVSVDIPAGATELTVNGQQLQLAAASPGESVEFVALPGDYAIAPPAGGKYVSFGGEQTLRIRADDPGATHSVAFTASPTDAVREDAIAAANAMIDACAAKAEFAPEDCPFGYTYYNDEEDYRNPVWTVDSYPTYTVDDSGSSLYLSTDDPGKVTLTYENNTEWDDDEPADWESEDTSDTVYVSAPIAVDGDSLSLDLSSFR